MEEYEGEIKWCDTLSVDVPEIDAGNRQLIARANALDRAIIECASKPKIKLLLDLILMEATDHFWHEQQLLAKWKYPDRADHVAMHAHLTEQLKRAMKGVEEADLSFTWAVKGLYIKQLLVDHLIKEDMKYRDFLRKQMAFIPGHIHSQRTRKLKLVFA